MNRILSFVFFSIIGFSYAMAQAEPLPDAMPVRAHADKIAKCNEEPAFKEFTSQESDYENDLNIDNLLKALDKYDVKCKKIVLAQALLETGYFTSDLCLQSHNLFGLRHPSDGSYYVFDNWEECVKAYHDDVQYKYHGGNYYAFLDNIGYAEDKNYTAKVMKIARNL